MSDKMKNFAMYSAEDEIKIAKGEAGINGELSIYKVAGDKERKVIYAGRAENLNKFKAKYPDVAKIVGMQVFETFGAVGRVIAEMNPTEDGFVSDSTEIKTRWGKEN